LPCSLPWRHTETGAGARHAGKGGRDWCDEDEAAAPTPPAEAPTADDDDELVEEVEDLFRL
tara:strand:+ start:252 stop:434 length:183 start_codon:yes stop_codon:yes gene_type:complete